MSRKRTGPIALPPEIPLPGILKFNSRGHQGACAELIAAAWLLGQGLEVFRNVSMHGPGDLVAWKKETGEFRAYDVKTVTVQKRKDGSKNYHSSPIAKGAFALFVFPDGRISETIECKAAPNKTRDWLIV